jgi:ribosomal protein S21
MIRRFTRKVKKAGILDEVKRRRYYKKPSEVRREKNIRRKRETAKLERKKK